MLRMTGSLFVEMDIPLLNLMSFKTDCGNTIRKRGRAVKCCKKAGATSHDSWGSLREYGLYVLYVYVPCCSHFQIIKLYQCANFILKMVGAVLELSVFISTLFEVVILTVVS